MRQVVDALAMPESWPFRTAVLTGPPRSGKSLLARWFAGRLRHGGEAIDDADTLDETELFHRWNRAQASGTPLLLVSGAPKAGKSRYPISKSRLGAALHLEIGQPDDDMARNLILPHGRSSAGWCWGKGRRALSRAALRAQLCRDRTAGRSRSTGSAWNASSRRRLAIWRAALEATLRPGATPLALRSVFG